MNYLISLIGLGMVAPGLSLAGQVNPNQSSYMCTASYIARQFVTNDVKASGGKMTNLDTQVVSSITYDFSESISGGGGLLMGGRPQVINQPGRGDVLYLMTNYLVDRFGNKLEPVGIYNNGGTLPDGKPGHFDMAVQFYNLQTQKSVGPKFKIVNEGSRIAQVQQNEFIQVSCNFVRRAKKPQ